MNNLVFKTLKPVVNKKTKPKNILAKLICPKKTPNTRFDETWLSVKLFGIAEAFILTLFGFFFNFTVLLFIETLAICMHIARTLLPAKPG